jgi:hypothetical protein
MDSCIDSSDSSYYKLAVGGSKVIFFYFPSSKCVNTNISAEKPPTISVNRKPAKAKSLGH